MVVREVGHRQIEPAVAVVVAHGDSHAGLLGTALAVGQAGEDRLLDERSVSLIDEQQVLHRVVGHVDVVVAVRIGIQDPYGDPVRRFERHQAGGLGRFDELRDTVAVRIPVVSVVPVGRRLEIARPAEDLHAAPDTGLRVRGLFAACRVAIEAEIDVVRHVQVEVAVEVGVGPRRRRRPVRTPHARAGGDIGKRPVAVVAVQPVGTPVRHVEIGVAIVVVVRDGDSDAPVPVAEPCRRGHVLEFRHAVPVVIAVIPVQPVGRSLGCVLRGALDEVQIGIAVAVVVQPGAAGPQRVDDVVGIRAAGHLDDVEPRGGGDVHEVRRRVRLAGLGPGLRAGGEDQNQRDGCGRSTEAHGSSFSIGSSRRTARVIRR